MFQSARLRVLWNREGASSRTRGRASRSALDMTKEDVSASALVAVDEHRSHHDCEISRARVRRATEHQVPDFVTFIRDATFWGVADCTGASSTAAAFFARAFFGAGGLGAPTPT